MLKLYIKNVEFIYSKCLFLKNKKYIHMGFHFVALILNNTMVQNGIKNGLMI